MACSCVYEDDPIIIKFIKVTRVNDPIIIKFIKVTIEILGTTTLFSSSLYKSPSFI